MKKNALGLYCGPIPTKEIFSAYAEAGVEVMELSPHDDDYERIFADRKNLCRMAGEHGVFMRSLHLPFGMERINFSAPDAEERKRTLALQLHMIEGAASLGCEVAVLHSGIPVVQAERPTCMEQAKEALFKLQTAASHLGVTVAVENLLPSCLGRNSAEILDLLSVHPDLRACFDANHLFKETHEDFLRAVGKKLISTHFSDYDFIDERHWLPGEGRIDWPLIMKTLFEVGYEGPILYEANPRITPKTITRRPLTLSDYRENYEALMRGERPAPIGTPNEEVCRSIVFAERYFKNFGVKYEA